MKKLIIASLLSAVVLPVPGQTLAVQQPLGSYVSTTTGPISLRFGITPPASSGAQIQLRITDTYGNIVSAGMREAPSSAKLHEAKLSLPAYGTFFVDASLYAASGSQDAVSTAAITVAAIPDNSRKSISKDSPFAMGCYFAMRYNPEELKAASRLASLAGVAFTREELIWNISEPKKGKVEWKQFDPGIQACMDHHIGVMGLLDYWGTFHNEKTTMTAEAVRDYAAYVKRTVQRYKPGGEFATQHKWPKDYGISDWEIWNEPATFWFYTPEAFGELTAAAHKAAHEADPNCRTFFANAGDSFDEKAMKAMGGKAFDGVTPHFYAPPRSPKDAGLSKMMAGQKEFFSKRGIHVPFWISEMGWYSDATREKQVSQADYLVQSYIIALAAGYDKIFWYNFVVDTPDKNAAEFGLLHRPDLSPKVSYAAYAGMVRCLDGAKFVKPLQLGRNISCYLFDGPSGKHTAVIWADEGKGMLSPVSGASAAPIEVRDMFANMLSAGSSAQTTIPLERSPHFVASGSPLEDILVSAKIAGIPQIDFTAEHTTGSLSVGEDVRFLVENFTKEPVEAAVSAVSSLVKFVSSPAIRVDPLSSASASLRISDFRREPIGNKYPIDAVCDLAKGAKLEKTFVLTEKVAVKGTPKIDGDLGDWGRALPMYLDSAEQVVGITPWMQWNLMAMYYLMWDDENLYFAARVTDNVHSQTHSGDSIWEGDSWQIGFDASPATTSTKPGGGPGRYVYGLALTEKGPEAVGWEGNKDASKIRVSIKKAPRQGATMITGGPPVTEELIYEAAIPKELLAPLVMQSGGAFRFSVLLNDNDGGGRMGWMESTPGIGTGFNPEQFDVIELIDRTKE